MNNLPPLNNPEELSNQDIQKYLAKALSNWYWFVLSVLVFGAAAYLLTRFTEPNYRVSATLVVNTDRQAVGAEALFSNIDMFGNQQNIQNEIGMLTSWSMARRALNAVDFEVSYWATDRLGNRHLYNNLPFRVTLGPITAPYTGKPFTITVLNDSIYEIESEAFGIKGRQKFNQTYQHKDLLFILSHNPDFDIESLPTHLRKNRYCFVINNLDHLARSYSSRLEVELTNRESSMLTLSIEDPVRQRGVDYINALMDEYIESDLDEKNRTATNTVRFIDDQLMGIVDTLRMAEQSLQEFRSRNQVIDISVEGSNILNQIDQLSQEKALADLQVEYSEYLMNYLNQNSDFQNVMAPSTMGINDATLTALISRLVELSNEKTSMEYSAKINNPALERLNMQIKANMETLQENVRNILENAKLKQNEVNRRIYRLNRRISDLPETERQLLNYQRKFTLQESIYNYLMQRRAEAAISQASNVPDQLIVDRARTDMATQISPKTKINYAIGLLFGLFLPFGIILLKDWLNNTVNEKTDVERRTQVPIFGTVGHNKRKEMIVSLTYPRSSIAESFRALRTNLQFSLHELDSKVAMITSSTSGEGKTFIALNLAGIYSVAGKRTVVVGLDLRKPTLQKYMNLNNKVGVSTYIIGKNSLEEIVHQTKYPNLDLITSGPVPPNPAELFGTEAFKRFIEELRQTYDMVILDTPPVALVTDAMLIAQHADTSLFIIRQKYTHVAALNFVNDMAEKEHVKKLSIVINDVVVPRYYGYRYGYGYGYGYGRGYGSGYYIDDKA